MVADYNHEAAREFVQALREGEKVIAHIYALAVTSDPNAINYGIPPDREYNDTELADLIQGHLNGIDQGRWDMTSLVHLPAVIGAICYWLAAEESEEDNGKVSSESLEGREEQDPTGS